MAVMIGNLIFTDSFQFTNKSLSNLADALPKDSFLWLSLPGDYRVTDEALLAETT